MLQVCVSTCVKLLLLTKATEPVKNANAAAKDAKDTVKEAVKDAAKDVKAAAQDKKDTVKETVKDAAKDLKDKAQATKEAVKDATKEVKENVKAAATDAKENVKAAAKDAKESVQEAAKEVPKQKTPPKFPKEAPKQEASFVDTYHILTLSIYIPTLFITSSQMCLTTRTPHCHCIR